MTSEVADEVLAGRLVEDLGVQVTGLLKINCEEYALLSNSSLYSEIGALTLVDLGQVGTSMTSPDFVLVTCASIWLRPVTQG